MTKITRYGDLQNGDIIHIQGYRFIVRDIRIASKQGDKTTLHSEPNRADVIRFKGECADTCSISRTSYNGGTYGGYADVACSAVRPQPHENDQLHTCPECHAEMLYWQASDHRCSMI